MKSFVRLLKVIGMLIKSTILSLLLLNGALSLGKEEKDDLNSFSPY